MINCLLTGGSGFLGKFIIAEMLSPDSPLPLKSLRIFDSTEYKGQADPRIEFIRGDILDQQSLNNACKGIDVVIHSAAIVDWGTHPPEKVYAVNTKGTANVINACKADGVKALVFTSSLDAVFGGKPLVNIDESIPYPREYPNMYCRSKCEAEQLVSAANEEGLMTVILRPADIWGEGDPFHIGSLLDMAKGGFYVRIGDGSSKSQHVYAGNMAAALIQAAKALLEGNNRIPGQAYFITDSGGCNFFHLYDAIVAAAGYRIWPGFWIPRPVAYAIGAMTEFSALLIRPFKKINVKFSRFAVIYTCSDFTFSSEKAVKDFGFKPNYSEEEAFSRTVEYYKKVR
ncbi:MAG: NAD-dependent epimerase/dehydratase family protein [Bacteroidetes bacterium]|nr:NAD-dependent epimerase/dehydratase family protein [Bacteroidota bacterium]